MLDIEDPLAAAAGTAPVGLDVPPQRLRSLAHAAQAAILQRLAPPLRHDMVVHLQSLGMMAEALSARLERGALGTDDLQGTVSKLNRLSRNAVARGLEVCSWMQPTEDDSVALRDGVAEIARLLSTTLSFRGFDLKVVEGDGTFECSRSALRFLLAAAILILVDSAQAPGEIIVRSESSASRGVVVVDYTPQQDGSYTQLHEAGEVPLSWQEVQALALEHGVELLRDEREVVLRLPRAVATTPLKMAPL